MECIKCSNINVQFIQSSTLSSWISDKVEGTGDLERWQDLIDYDEEDDDHHLVTST